MATTVAAALTIAQEDSSTDDLPLEDQIRSRAREICEQRGGTSGGDVADWLRAEQEIIACEEYRKSWEDQYHQNPSE